MSAFWQDVQSFPFLQYALVTGVLAAIACGIIGTYVAVRRITYIAGAIAHCTLGGMGVARYCQKVLGLDFLSPLLGAMIAALLAAVIIGLVTLYGKEREDTVLSAVWSLGMAIGIFFISRTPGYNEDLMSYLFGNILIVGKNDLYLIAGLDAVVVVVSIVFYNKLLVVCFDEEFAWLQGLHVQFYYLLLLCLTAVTVVLLTQVVGIVMVIAMLTLPAAAAARFVGRLWQMIVLAILLSMLCNVGGLALSYAPDLPTGATIILLAGFVYVISLFIGGPSKRLFTQAMSHELGR